MVFDLIGIEIHAFHRRPCPTVVVGAERVVQQKLCPSLRSVNFERDHSHGPNQDSILALLRDHKGTLCDPEAAAKFGRQHDGATAPNSAGQCSHKCQNSRQPEYRADGSRQQARLSHREFLPAASPLAEKRSGGPAFRTRRLAHRCAIVFPPPSVRRRK
jgi:hypothetical protein